MANAATPRPDAAESAPNVASRHPSFAEAFRFWLKLGFISFGGPTGQIAVMHAELVEKRRWISERRFLHALNYCMLLPGPEAQQLATYVGWLLHGAWGGIVAGGLFVLPSVFILWGLSYVYVEHGDLPMIAAIFTGLKPAVLAIVAAAVLRIGRRVLKNWIMWGLAGAAFVAIFFLHVPFPIIIFAAGLIGLMGQIWSPRLFVVVQGHGGAKKSQTSDESHVIGDDDVAPAHARPTLSRAVRVTAVCLALWWAPIGLLAWNSGSQSVHVQQGVFFSKAAMVTFGGAYAVLPYVAQQAVDRHGWLSSGQMLDGLGLAETTPGPLIMVVQFVGFLGGWQHADDSAPLYSATIGALISTWATFLPCFLWIFLGAPHIEQLRASDRLSAALSAITAAVVGVVLNLAVWFGMKLLQPAPDVFDWFAMAVATASFFLMTYFRWDVMWVVGAGAAAGLIYGQFA